MEVKDIVEGTETVVLDIPSFLSSQSRPKTDIKVGSTLHEPDNRLQSSNETDGYR